MISHTNHIECANNTIRSAPREETSIIPANRRLAMILYEYPLAQAVALCAVPVIMKLQFHLSDNSVSCVRTNRMCAFLYAGIL